MNHNFSEDLKKIEDSIKKFLPEISFPEWQGDVFGFESDVLKNEHIEPLLKPTRSLVDLGGKRWRPLLLVLCAKSCLKGVDSEIAYDLAPLVEFVHTASLIHDDIEDSSEYRRGKPAAYITYGVDVAINAGSWLYFMASVCIKKSNLSLELQNMLYDIYLEELRRLHLGQAMDIKWHNDNTREPSVEEYIVMVKNKTGTLASLAAKIGCMSSGADGETVRKAGIIASEIGAGFQIIDDVINLTVGNPGKKRGDDIVEGKKSLPVLMYMEKFKNSPEKREELLECFKTASKEGIESPSVEKAINLLNAAGAIENAKKSGIEYINEGCDSFRKLFGYGNEYASQIEFLFKSMIPPALLKKEEADA